MFEGLGGTISLNVPVVDVCGEPNSQVQYRTGAKNMEVCPGGAQDGGVRMADVDHG